MRAEVRDQLGLRARGHLVEHVDLEASLYPEERCEQADRPGPSDQHEAAGAIWSRAPMRHMWSQALATTLVGSSSTPRWPREGASFHQEVGGGPVALPCIAVVRLDAPFGVVAVAAHVPLAGGTVQAGLGVGPAYYPGDQVARRETGAFGRLEHLTDRLVAEDEALLPGGAHP